MIVWIVDGESPAGDPLDGDAGGVFTTSGSGGGNCTNEIGSLTVGKGTLYVQTAGAPALNPTTPSAFVACGSVACGNWTTTNLSLTVPGGAEADVTATPIPGHYSLTVLAANQPALDAAYPNGNYGFTLEAAAGNFTCAVNFPASLAFPNAPHLTNFTTAQAVDALPGHSPALFRPDSLLLSALL